MHHALYVIAELSPLLEYRHAPWLSICLVVHLFRRMVWFFHNRRPAWLVGGGKHDDYNPEEVLADTILRILRPGDRARPGTGTNRVGHIVDLTRRTSA